MKTVFRTLVAASLIGVSACATTESPEADLVLVTEPLAMDRVAIQAVISDYFDGQTENNLSRLDRAFNDGAAMFGLRKNDAGEDYVRVWPDMNGVIDGWIDEPTPNAPKRDGEILSIDVVDGRLATVIFRYTDRFYDAFSMVKVNGQWEIVSKVFITQ